MAKMRNAPYHKSSLTRSIERKRDKRDAKLVKKTIRCKNGVVRTYWVLGSGSKSKTKRHKK